VNEQAEMERTQQRMFPIQGGPAIPWVVIAPCDRQCQRNHGRQTLEHIAERGGLGVSEAIDVLLAQRWGTTELRGGEAQEVLAKIVKDRWYLPKIERLKTEVERQRGWPDASRLLFLEAEVERLSSAVLIVDSLRIEVERLEAQLHEAQQAILREGCDVERLEAELGRWITETEKMRADNAQLKYGGDGGFALGMEQAAKVLDRLSTKAASHHARCIREEIKNQA